MSQALYEETLARFTKGNPMVRQAMPDRWPASIPQLSRRETIRALRSVAATRNEGVLLVGWGDGSAFQLLRQDQRAGNKKIKAAIFPSERAAFAHALGNKEMLPLFERSTFSFTLLREDQDPGAALANAYYNEHGDISRLVGDRLCIEHPLIPEAEAQRSASMPQIKRALIERLDMLGNDVYDTFSGARQALAQGKPLMTRLRASEIAGRWKGASAIVIASGPSASRHLDRIREIQHEHIIIAADSFLSGLLDAGIEPDFVCMVERTDDQHKLIDDGAGRCTTQLVVTPWVHPSSVAPFGDRVIWWWNPDDLYPWLDPKEPRRMAGRSTGTLGVALAAELGCDTIYLAGHDLAFDNGKSHSGEAAPFAHEVQQRINRELSRSHPNYYRRIIDVERNGGGLIETMGVWNLFRQDLGIIVSVNARPERRFVNLNIEDGIGAEITGCVGGKLPEPSGNRLDKSIPEADPKRHDWDAFLGRCRSLIEDMTLIKEHCESQQPIFDEWDPLTRSIQEVNETARSIDITRIVRDENAIFFRYIFRAAMRNLMVKLQQNTYVRTLPEMGWNQIQVMRLYSRTIPALVDKLKPELERTIEEAAA